jgi:transcriptional regulator with PAS, ATPase and Fis domain
MVPQKNPYQGSDDLSYHEAMERYSQHLLAEALREAGGDQDKAAQMLKLKNNRPGDDHLSYHDLMERQSRLLILDALGRANGSSVEAAQQLKLSKTYLARLIKQKAIFIT